MNAPLDSLSRPSIRLLSLMLLVSLSALIFSPTSLHPLKRSANARSHKTNDSVPARLDESISVRAAGRGNPTISLDDGRSVITASVGEESIKKALESNQARPLSLASGDFNEDGVADLVSGYAGPQGGFLTIHFGNTESVFSGPASVFGVPEAADFVGAGDFDGDNRQDIVTAARDGDNLYLLAGNGQGGFGIAKQINLPGRATAMVTGEINRRDGLNDLVLAVTGPGGAKALVFEGPDGALKSKAEIFDLPAEAGAIALGQLDDDLLIDIAIASGSELVIVHGRDRRLSLDEHSRIRVPAPEINRQTMPYIIKSAATGNFTGGPQSELALLSDTGEVHLPATGKKSDNQSIRLTRSGMSGASRMVKAKLSSTPYDDLVLVSEADRALEVLASEAAGGRRTVLLEVEGDPVATMPMRLNRDRFDDLIVLNADSARPVVALSSPLDTFTVTNTDDDGAGSLRQAIIDANDNSGADMIVFNIPGIGVPTITPQSPLPAITGAVTLDGTTQAAGLVRIDGENLPGDIGIEIQTGDCSVSGLVIINFSEGIVLAGGSNNSVRGCRLGIDPGGPGSGGMFNGLRVESTICTIGGTTPADRNIISSNTVGIAIGSGGDGAVIQGNFIGTDLNGSTASGNENGIEIDDSGSHTIGGTAPGARNLISGNTGGFTLGVTGYGIFSTGSSMNLIQGNFIGADATGTSAIPNGEDGIFFGIEFDDSSMNLIGGTTPAARNIISGNGGSGIFFNEGEFGGEFVADDNIIQGNYIGLDVTGSARLGNLFGVILIAATDSLIGGATPGARNVVSDNLFGMLLLDGNSQVQGNFVGTDATGTQDRGNESCGIAVSENAVDHQLLENVIAFNGFQGICLPDPKDPKDSPGLKIAITSNSIFSNGDAGIDLGSDGLTRNDPNDPDRGANNLQNFPVITSVSSMNGITRIMGALNSTPNTDFYVQFFSSQQCTNSNPGQNQQVLTLPILFRTGPDNGNPYGIARIDVTLTNTPVSGFVNATARDPLGNTSEFSPCAEVNGAPSCSYSLDSTAQSFSANGGTGIVNVTAGDGCAWNAITNSSFITITTAPDGVGNDAVGYQVAANMSQSQRMGTMTIAGITFTVTQDGASACTFSLSSKGQNFTADGGGGNFTVTTQAGCNWSPASDVGWITATRNGSVVSFFVGSNSSVQRTGHIIVQDQTYTVTQNGAAAPCTFSISPESATFPASGGSNSFTLTTNVSCVWSAAANVPWITVAIGGAGGGLVGYTVAANTGPARTGQVFIEGQPFTVNQDAGCAFTLGETSESFAASSAAGSVTVTAAQECTWIAVNNNPDFITITSGDTGAGSGTISYTVAQNTSTSPRSGTIIIAGQTYMVLQGAAFLDVPLSHVFYTEIGKLSARGVTLGCDTGLYCPDLTVTRQQMAAFIIRALGDFNPPPPAMQRFIDVPPSNPFYAFIEQMAIRQITLGCTANMYCPTDPVLRDQMAAFIIRALHEPGYIPPQPAMQRFPDVPPTNPFYAHIEEMAVRQITLGCGGGNYCPSLEVSRGQMAAFLVRAFNL